MFYQTLRDCELDIIIKAWRDESFRKRLILDPKRAIEEEFGIEIPENQEIFVHEEDEEKIHLIVPKKPKEIKSQTMTDDEILGKIHDILESHHVTSWPLTNSKVNLKND